jgi:hypothetical protein
VFQTKTQRKVTAEELNQSASNKQTKQAFSQDQNDDDDDFSKKKTQTKMTADELHRKFDDVLTEKRLTEREILAKKIEVGTHSDFIMCKRAKY